MTLIEGHSGTKKIILDQFTLKTRDESKATLLFCHVYNLVPIVTYISILLTIRYLGRTNVI